MRRARVNRLAAVVAGASLLVGGLYVSRLSRLAAPKGALFIVVGALLVIVAVWPDRRHMG